MRSANKDVSRALINAGVYWPYIAKTSQRRFDDAQKPTDSIKKIKNFLRIRKLEPAAFFARYRENMIARTVPPM